MWMVDVAAKNDITGDSLISKTSEAYRANYERIKKQKKQMSETNETIDDILYESGLVAQGCWDELDEYDREAIVTAIKLTAQRCFEISNNYVIKQEFDL